MRRQRKRMRSVYHPYQGRRRRSSWVILAVLLLAALAAAWLWRDALLGLLLQFTGR